MTPQKTTPYPNLYRVSLKSASVSLVCFIRSQLLLSASCLFTLLHTLAPRSPNRRASLHRSGALTSLLRARTGLCLCLSHLLTVICSVDAQYQLTPRAAAFFLTAGFLVKLHNKTLYLRVPLLQSHTINNTEVA